MKYAGVTGFAASHLPPGPGLDETLVLIRMGIIFSNQHSGRRPGVLARTVLQCLQRAGPPYTFVKLLDELSSEAANRALYGESASPIEKVDRVWQLVTFHPGKGIRKQVTFSAIEQQLTRAKKILIT